MPPNQKGGKGYKKGKHSSEESKMFDWDESDGQMLGRVTKTLGNRRFKIYCNDNKERICKLCGSIRKGQWVNDGCIVLISLRGLSDRDDDADIIHVPDSGLYSKLKKMEGVNPSLFIAFDGKDVQKVMKNVADGKHEDDELFVREGDEEEEVVASSASLSQGVVGDIAEDVLESLSKLEKKKEMEVARAKKDKERDMKRGAERSRKNDDDGEIDIDAI
jgi:initiation factor 1A